MSIGIYGGTFDPIHFGHLRPALEVYEALALQEVRFIPCSDPPHRHKPLADPQQRLAMVKAAIRDQPVFKVDQRELQREGPSYMVDTLASLRQELGTTALYLIVGSDAFLRLTTWRRWESIIELSHIVVTHRPGWSFEALQQDSGLQQFVNNRQTTIEEMKQRSCGGVIFQAVTQLYISSTQIRDLVKQGKDIRYLVPEPVYQLIREQNIYR